MKELSKELIASSLAPMVMMILRRGENYGYEIIQQLRNHTSGHLDVAEGTLYPVLKKMEVKGWIEGTWKKSEAGRERKYYSITDEGRKELEQQYSQWTLINELIHKLWNQPALTYHRLSTITLTM